MRADRRITARKQVRNSAITRGPTVTIRRGWPRPTLDAASLLLVTWLALVPSAALAQGPCLPSPPLHLPNPTPPAAFFEHEMDDKAGILGAVDLDFGLPARDGAAFRPDGHITYFPFDDAFPTMTEGSFAFWLYNHAYYGSSGVGALFINTDNELHHGFNIELGIGLSGTDATLQRLRFLLRDPTNGHRSVMARIHNWSPGEWRHIAATWGHGVMRLFIDGRPVGQTSDLPADMMAAPAGTLTPNKLYLLSSGRSASNAAGRWTMDRFHSYDGPLAPEEITHLYLSEVDRSGPMLDAGRMRIKLLGPKDGYGLEAVRDQTAGRLITTELPPGRWWRLLFAAADAPGAVVTIDNSVIQTVPTCSVGAMGQLTLDWEFELPDLQLTDNTTAAAKARLVLTPLQDEVEARLFVKHASARPETAWTLNLVGLRFGGIGAIDPAAGDSFRMYLPQHYIGSFVDHPAQSMLAGFTGGNQGWHNPMGFGNNRYPSRNMNMQWVGLVDAAGKNASLYFAAHDPSLQVKSFFYDNSVGDPYSGSIANRTDLIAEVSDLGIDLETVVFASDIGGVGNGYSQNWPVVFRIGDGDWWDLAQRYRQFALQQVWTNSGPLARRTDSPAWFQDLGLVQPSTIYSDSAPDSGIINRLEIEMQALATANGFVPDSLGHLLWHFTSWHCEGRTGSFHQANDLPFFCLGPTFRLLVAEANGKGTPTAIYTLPRDWELARDRGSTAHFDFEDWNRLKGWEHIIVGRFQQPEDLDDFPTEDEDLNEPQVAPLAMDPNSRLWADLNQELYDTLAATPIEGFYLDVLTTAQPRLCFNPDHPHRPGGGDYLVQGARRLIADLKSGSQTTRAELKVRLLAEADVLDQEAAALHILANDLDQAGLADDAAATRAAADAKTAQAQQNRDREAELGSLAFYGEGFAEVYADQMDGNLVWNLDEFNPQPFPLAMAVYHDYTQFMGRRSSVGGIADAAVMEGVRQVAVARSGQLFVWGGMPGFLLGVHDGGTTGEVKLRAYHLRLARWRRVFKNYLTTGVMLRPPSVAVVSPPIPSPGGEPVMAATGTPADAGPAPFFSAEGIEGIPVVEASLWAKESSLGFGVGLVAASLESDAAPTCNPCQIYVAWDGDLIADRLGTSRARVMQVELDGTRTPLFPVDVTFTSGLLVELEPERVFLFELQPF